MKSNNSAFYQNMVKPTSSKSSAKQLLFEEEQKKRATKRSAALGNMQRTGVSSSPKQTTMSSIAKPQSANSSGSGNSGGIIQTKQNAFSPTAAAQRTGMTNSIYKPQSSTRTAMGGAGRSTAVQSGQRSHTAAGGYNAGRRPQEQGGNITRLTRNEAWNMLGEESKRKQSFRFPQDLSEDGGNVLMQLMELPDWGLDHEKKNEKVVELKRSVPNTSADVKKETPLRVPTAYGNLGKEGRLESVSVEEQQLLDNEHLNNEDRFLSGLSSIASEQIPTLAKLLNSIVNYWENKQNDYTGGFITDQSKFQGSDLRYGYEKMSRAGCEIISVYNLLLDLEKSPSLADVALWFQLTGGQMFGGFLGNNPYYIDRVLSHYDIPNTRYYSAEQLQQDAHPGDKIVISYCWKNDLGLPQYHTYYSKVSAYDEKPLFTYNKVYDNRPKRY
ncbi:MAG: hypothetical protein IKV55_02445, partial [Oscillospiraceae bacterium]|nr:hypothetical protein [Oscillospiraceae bacterium]